MIHFLNSPSKKMYTGELKVLFMNFINKNLPSTIFPTENPIYEPMSAKQAEKRMSSLDKERMITLVKLHLKNNSFDHLDWKRVSDWNKVSITQNRNVWDHYLHATFKQRQGRENSEMENLLEQLLNVEISCKSESGNVNWSWIAEGLSSPQEKLTQSDVIRYLWNSIQGQKELPSLEFDEHLRRPLPLEAEELIPIIKAKLKISHGDIQVINWQWISHYQKEDAEKIKALWDRELFKLYQQQKGAQNPWGNYDTKSQQVMKLIAYERFQKTDNEPIDWSWIADGLPKGQNTLSASSCWELWQKTLLQNKQ